MNTAEKKYLLSNVESLENCLDYLKEGIKTGKITGQDIDGYYKTYIDYHVSVLKRDIKPKEA